METLKALYFFMRGPSYKRPTPNYNELLEVPESGFYAGLSLEEEIWYYGFLRNDETIEIFSTVKRGTFLVRKMQTYDGLKYVVSVKGHDKMYNVLVNRTEKKCLYWVDIHAFHTIQQLVAFYLESGIPIRVDSPEGEKLELVLKAPAKRIGWQVEHEQIELNERLGGGQFGDVHRAVLNQTFFRGRKEVAVKTLKQKNLTNQQKYDLLREADTMKRFDHENVIVFFGVAASLDPFMIAMEFCEEDALAGIVKASALPVGKKIKYLLHAARGIHYLHTLGIVHGDIACRNCLVSRGDVVKITDFGLSVEQNSLRHRSEDAPFRYWAPELREEREPESPRSDVFSYSVMIFEMFHKCDYPYGEFAPDDSVPQAISDYAIELYLFDRPQNETWPSHMTRDISTWMSCMEKPDNPPLCAEITFLFEHCRFVNVKFRAEFPEDCPLPKRSIIKYWEKLVSPEEEDVGEIQKKTLQVQKYRLEAEF